MSAGSIYESKPRNTLGGRPRLLSRLTFDSNAHFFGLNTHKDRQDDKVSFICRPRLYLDDKYVG